METVCIFQKSNNTLCAVVEKPKGIDTETILKAYCRSLGLSDQAHNNFRAGMAPVIMYRSIRGFLPETITV